MVLRSILGAGVAAAMLALAGPGAQAGPTGTALLEAYLGSWIGSGVLTGGEEPTGFDCRLLTRSGNAGKLVFSGNCPLLSGAGTIAYVESAERYELAMTTNADYGGGAIGAWEDDDLVFAIRDRNEGNAMQLSAELAMRGETITVSFSAVVDGEPWSGEVTFRR